MTREVLPNRREIETFKFFHENIRYHCSFSRYSDGRIAEIFVDAGKVNAGVQTLMRDGAIIISLALQHGASLATIKHAMTMGENDLPASPLGKLLEVVMEKV